MFISHNQKVISAVYKFIFHFNHTIFFRFFCFLVCFTSSALLKSKFHATSFFTPNLSSYHTVFASVPLNEYCSMWAPAFLTGKTTWLKPWGVVCWHLLTSGGRQSLPAHSHSLPVSSPGLAKPEKYNRDGILNRMVIM